MHTRQLTVLPICYLLWNQLKALRLRLVVHQERREPSRSLINPHTAHSSSSHLPMPGLRSSHLGYGLHLAEHTGLRSLRMGAHPDHRHRLALATPVSPHPRAGVDVGVQTLHPLQCGRDGLNPVQTVLCQCWEPSEGYPGRRSQAGAQGLERS